MTDASGHIAENIMHFGRVLRTAGLPIGPGMVIEAIKAVEAVGIRRRDDFYWALHSVFVNRQDQVELFDQAFHIFWRDPRILQSVAGMLMPRLEGDEDQQSHLSRRLSEAISPGIGENSGDDAEEKVELDARLTFSDRERLQSMDFEGMSGEEMAQAKALIAKMRLPLMQVPTRRLRPSARGHRVDMRATLRASLRSGGDLIPLKRRDHATRHPPLVVLCDISGSMSRYSRLFLHFVHAITNDRDRVHTFLFGTKLTNITRHLKHRDIDLAMERIGEAVTDWSGGTRIGTTLAEFNRNWSRRVLGQGALVLFISDGLDRDAGAGLGGEIERLHKSCRRLIWLNPLLRWDGFEAKSIGIRTILPHVDEFRPVHSLDSLADLADILSKPPQRREDRFMGGSR
jgi:uncharacterized protein with von Willebrand factor type A (vWA) domain